MNILRFVKNIYHHATAYVFHFLYGFPARKLRIIGITGTDGKTTTVSLIYHILKYANKKVSLLSTVAAYIGPTEIDTGFHVTSPDPHTLPRYLAQSVANGDEFFILETTSHALDQGRVAGIRFAIGLITNITHEHLDYHKTFDAYVRTKCLLLRNAHIAYANGDHPKILAIIKRYIDPSRLQLFSKKDFDIEHAIGVPLSVYNQENYMAAYRVCVSLGISDTRIFTAMKSYKTPPGRMEVVHNETYVVIIDFAHTPRGIEAALHAVKKNTKGRLIHVFGAASQRDSSKRPFMGAASAQYADHIILTEEDCRTEDPYVICTEIASGFPAGYTNYEIITDRKLAIEQAVAYAQPQDTVIITGKGHEKSLCRGTVEYPWSDHDAVSAAIHK